MEDIRGQLVELLRKAVAFRKRDDYVPAKELEALVGIWKELNVDAGGDSVVRVVLEKELEDLAS